MGKKKEKIGDYMGATKEQVARVREALGMDKIELANKMEYSGAVVGYVERGRNRITKRYVHKLNRVAEEMGRRDLVIGKAPATLETLRVADIMTNATDLESVLSQPSFPKQSAYCPNIECPATRYRWQSQDERGQPYIASRTIQELEEYRRYRRFIFPPADEPELEGLYCSHDWAPSELLQNRPDIEVVYRWGLLDENTKFCEYCGTQLRSTCMYCDAALKMRNQKFCHACGRRLNRPGFDEDTSLEGEN